MAILNCQAPILLPVVQLWPQERLIWPQESLIRPQDRDSLVVAKVLYQNNQKDNGNVGNPERKAGSRVFLWKENSIAWLAPHYIRQNLYRWIVTKNIMIECIQKTTKLNVINVTSKCLETIFGNTRQNIARNN